MLFFYFMMNKDLKDQQYLHFGWRLESHSDLISISIAFLGVISLFTKQLQLSHLCQAIAWIQFVNAYVFRNFITCKHFYPAVPLLGTYLKVKLELAIKKYSSQFDFWQLNIGNHLSTWINKLEQIYTLEFHVIIGDVVAMFNDLDMFQYINRKTWGYKMILQYLHFCLPIDKGNKMLKVIS